MKSERQILQELARRNPALVRKLAQAMMEPDEVETRLKSLTNDMNRFMQEVNGDIDRMYKKHFSPLILAGAMADDAFDAYVDGKKMFFEGMRKMDWSISRMYYHLG